MFNEYSVAECNVSDIEVTCSVKREALNFTRHHCHFRVSEFWYKKHEVAYKWSL
jgi:hypothetical protein